MSSLTYCIAPRSHLWLASPNNLSPLSWAVPDHGGKDRLLRRSTRQLRSSIYGQIFPQTKSAMIIHLHFSSFIFTSLHSSPSLCMPLHLSSFVHISFHSYSSPFISLSLHLSQNYKYRASGSSIHNDGLEKYLQGQRTTHRTLSPAAIYVTPCHTLHPSSRELFRFIATGLSRS